MDLSTEFKANCAPGVDSLFLDADFAPVLLADGCSCGSSLGSPGGPSGKAFGTRIAETRIAEDAPDYGPIDSSEESAGDDDPGPRADRFVSCGVAERCREAETLRLAMALVDGTRAAAADRAATVERLRASMVHAGGAAPPPETDDAIAARLRSLARRADRNIAELLPLLVRFDDAGLYAADGCRSMVVWMDVHLGVGRIVACERLRVGRALANLPILESLFALGQISYSKLRAITRYASPATDAEFAIATLELSVTETQEYCERFRHLADHDEDAATASLEGLEAAEAKAALRAYSRRSLSVRALDAHSKRITLDLPSELAAEWLGSLQQLEDWIREGGEDPNPGEASTTDTITNDTKPTAAQIRADAALLMSRRSLSGAGDAVAMADRYRVHVDVDVRLLAQGPILIDSESVDGEEPIERPSIRGHGPISRETARRLAAEAGFTLVVIDDEGELVGTMKVAPEFSKKQLRELFARDRRCQVPGCGATRHLHGHHLVHREHGGRSTLNNAAAACAPCHRLLHEGGFRLERRASADIDLGAAAAEIAAVAQGDEQTDEQGHNRSAARAREKVARIRRFRLLDKDGREHAGVRNAWAAAGLGCLSPASVGVAGADRPVDRFHV